MWNLRLELGQHLTPFAMRMMEVSPAQETSPAAVAEPAPVAEPISYGPPQWARRSFTKGFAGSDFVLQADGTLRCPADHPLTVHERRPERKGSVRMVYGARLCHCRPCPLRAQCQETATTIKPRQVSAVVWPLSSHASVSTASLTVLEPLPPQLPPAPAPFPVLWGDWPRCSIRRRWVQLLRSQTVMLPSAPLQRSRNTRANRQRDTPELNVRIGVSRGMSVSPVTLAHPMPRRLSSLFMAFLPPLRTSLAWHSWLLRNRLPVCSFWRRSCSPACKGERPSAASHLAVVTDKQCGMSACHARL